jgi:hypothetical protein
VIQDLLLSDPRLAGELQRQWCSRAAINAVHSYRLDRIEGLAGFTGIRGVGVRVPHTSTTPNNVESGKYKVYLWTIFVLIYFSSRSNSESRRYPWNYHF